QAQNHGLTFGRIGIEIVISRTLPSNKASSVIRLPGLQDLRCTTVTICRLASARTALKLKSPLCFRSRLGNVFVMKRISYVNEYNSLFNMAHCFKDIYFGANITNKIGIRM